MFANFFISEILDIFEKRYRTDHRIGKGIINI